MWEIFSYGQQPYGEIEENKEIRRGVIHQKVRRENPIRCNCSLNCWGNCVGISFETVLKISRPANCIN